MFFGNIPFTGNTPTMNPFGFSTHPGFHPGFQTGYWPSLPTMTPAWTPWSGAQSHPQNSATHLPIDQIHLTQRMDLLCQQMAHLTEIVKTYGAMLSGSAQWMNRGWNTVGNTVSPSAPFGMPNTGNTGFIGGIPGYSGFTSSPVGVGYEHGGLQIRETENFICWQIPFTNLNLGDIEVEVLGNRVICRTKTVVPPAHRFWQWTYSPQGVQFFELPDGRVECSCVIPVAFDAKDVEATFKDGSISIYVVKTETHQRQSVKIGKDTPQYVTASSGSRKAAEMRT